MRRTFRVTVVAFLSVVGLLSAAAAAAARPDYDVPFPCGQSWYGATRPTHSPSKWSVDFSRADDEGDLVVASAPGEVTTAKYLGDVSYGRYVVVDHGGGFSTLHAHLDKMLVVVGETVDKGDPLGLVGNVGNSFGAHLHYEQRLNRTDEAAVFAGAPFVYNTYVASDNCLTVPITGDWDGNGRTEVGAFQRAASAGRFRERAPNGAVRVIAHGLSSDTPLVGDWNGDGKDDVGSWRAVGHQFSLLSNGNVRTISFGGSRDIPVVGDWDGNRVTDVGVWRPAHSKFILRLADGSVLRYRLGSTNDIPLTGDWDGDGKHDVGVYDPATSVFTQRKGDGSQKNRQFGVPGDLPVTGDWNGDGVFQVGVWSPVTATFTWRVRHGALRSTQFGAVR